MNKLKIISLTASMVLAMVFTFSCSDDGGGNNNTSTCGDKEYNAAIYTCDKGELVGFCRGNSYYPEYQYCDSNGEIKEGTEISSSSLSSVGSPSSSSSAGGQGGGSSSSVGGGQSSSSSSSVGSQGGGSSSSVGGGQSSSSSSSAGSQVGGSSSSVGGGQSSSSSSSVGGQGGGLCAGFVEGTEREHYGKMKKQFCDGRDGQKYVYVTIGDQTWMAENLNYEVSGSKCYSNLESNCNIYGRLYDWSTAMNFVSSCNSYSCSSQIQSKHQGICPAGWHIPSQGEWNTFLRYVQSNDGNDTDQYGFSALPGGIGGSNDYFNDVGDNGYWWSASENGIYESGRYRAYYRSMHYFYDTHWDSNYKASLLSVRCLQD